MDVNSAYLLYEPSLFTVYPSSREAPSNLALLDFVFGHVGAHLGDLADEITT